MDGMILIEWKNLVSYQMCERYIFSYYSAKYTIQQQTEQKIIPYKPVHIMQFILLNTRFGADQIWKKPIEKYKYMINQNRFFYILLTC